MILQGQAQLPRNNPQFFPAIKMASPSRMDFFGQALTDVSLTKGVISLFNPLMIDNQVFDYFNPLQIVISRNFENVYV